MKLELWKEQTERKKTGVVFKLTARVAFSEQELEWVDRYDQRQRHFGVGMEAQTAKRPKGTSLVTVEELMDRVSVESAAFLSVLEAESKIREFCREFRMLLNSMAAFRDYEVVEVDISEPSPLDK